MTMKTVDDLVRRWENERGPFGDIGWCEFCIIPADKYVQVGTAFYFLCCTHYKEFTQVLALGKLPLDTE